MKKVSTLAAKQSRNISQPKLTIGLDLGDRNSWYCMVDEAGQIRVEQRVRTNAKALEEVFGALPRCRIALETGTHSPWIRRFGAVRAADAYQQGRRSLSAHAAGAGRTTHSGTVRHRLRSAALGTETGRARRKKREETSDHRDRTKAGRAAASLVGKRRGLPTLAQQQPGSIAGGGIKSKTFCERKRQSLKPSSGDCVNRLARVPLETSRTRGRQTDGSTGCNENAQHAPSETNRSLRVRMEAWRQRPLGGRKTLSNEKQWNLLDSDRPSHGRRFHSLTSAPFPASPASARAPGSLGVGGY